MSSPVRVEDGRERGHLHWLWLLKSSHSLVVLPEQSRALVVASTRPADSSELRVAVAECDGKC